jgi:hypothetical protein
LTERLRLKRVGVAVKLQRIIPWLFAVHCVAHKLALVCADACKVNNWLEKKFRSAMNATYQYFDNSPVRLATLKKVKYCLRLELSCFLEGVRGAGRGLQRFVQGARRALAVK